MSKLLQPYKIGGDVGLIRVNFERTCEKMRFERESWPQRLLTVLPCEAADVIARLSREEAEDYERVKAALLRKYRLSKEEFRQRFRKSERKPDESYAEFAYGLKANLVEWLKSEGAYGDHDKVVECVGLEQFYRSLQESVRFWVQDRPEVETVRRAAELADEYVSRRGEHKEPRATRDRKSESAEKGKYPQARRSEARDGQSSQSQKSNEVETARGSREVAGRTDDSQARKRHLKRGNLWFVADVTKRGISR